MSQRHDADPVPDARLTRLGREWFADVRRRHPEPGPEPERTARKDRSASGDDGGLLDWLLGDGDGDDVDGGGD